MRVKEYQDTSTYFNNKLIVRRYAKKLGYRYQVVTWDGFTCYSGNDKNKAVSSLANGYPIA